MIATSRITLTLACFCGAVAPTLADDITLTDGSVLEGVDVQEETLSEVSYKRDRASLSVESDKVRFVTYERLPEEIDTALGFLAEGDFLSTLQYLDGYVDDQIEKSTERRYRWAPAYAAWRALEIRMRTADLEGVTRAATRLVKSFPDSRYVPAAYLAKASAERQQGYPGDSRDTLDELSKLISSKGLSKLWDLECRLARLHVGVKRTDEVKRAEFEELANEAASEYPVPAARARLARAQSFLAEAEGTMSSSQAESLRKKARDIFSQLVQENVGDHGVMAGAHTGLGDCLFFSGADKDDEELLRRAAMHYLRVVLLYETQSEYVPKSLFFAMRCFHLMKDAQRRADMQRELQRLYPDSEWAKRPEAQ